MAECLVCVPPAEVPDAEILDHLRCLHPDHLGADPAEVDDLTVTAESFPYGLRCGRCMRLMKDGDRYAEELTGLIGALPMVEIICIPCDEAITDG